MGCREAAEAPAAPAEAEGGATGDSDRVHLEGELAQTAELTLRVEGHRDCPDGELPPHPGNRYFAVEVTVEARSAAGAPANAAQFTLRGPSGRSHRGVLRGCSPRLPTAPVLPGAPARGHVNFELPALERGTYTLVHEAPGLAAPAAPLTFRITR